MGEPEVPLFYNIFAGVIGLGAVLMIRSFLNSVSKGTAIKFGTNKPQDMTWDVKNIQPQLTQIDLSGVEFEYVAVGYYMKYEPLCLLAILYHWAQAGYITISRVKDQGFLGGDSSIELVRVGNPKKIPTHLQVQLLNVLFGAHSKVEDEVDEEIDLGSDDFGKVKLTYQKLNARFNAIFDYIKDQIYNQGLFQLGGGLIFKNKVLTPIGTNIYAAIKQNLIYFSQLSQQDIIILYQSNPSIVSQLIPWLALSGQEVAVISALKGYFTPPERHLPNKFPQDLIYFDIRPKMMLAATNIQKSKNKGTITIQLDEV